MLRPVIYGLAAKQDIRTAFGIPNLEDFRELLEGELVAHRSDPFFHRCRHLTQVGDLPFRPVAHERDLALCGQARTQTTLLHDDTALFGFLSFDFAVPWNFHNRNTLFQIRH